MRSSKDYSVQEKGFGQLEASVGRELWGVGISFVYQSYQCKIDECVGPGLRMNAEGLLVIWLGYWVFRAYGFRATEGPRYPNTP